MNMLVDGVFDSLGKRRYYVERLPVTALSIEDLQVKALSTSDLLSQQAVSWVVDPHSRCFLKLGVG